MKLIHQLSLILIFCMISGCTPSEVPISNENSVTTNTNNEKTQGVGTRDNSGPRVTKEADVKNADVHEKLTHEDMVRESVKNFNEGIRSTDEVTRLSALNKILPTKANLVEIFGETAGVNVWEKIQPALDEMRENSEAFRDEVSRGGNLIEISVIDSRDDGVEFEGISDDIPIYQVVKRFESRTSGSSSYLILDGRVVFIRGLEKMARYVKSEQANE